MKYTCEDGATMDVECYGMGRIHLVTNYHSRKQRVVIELTNKQTLELIEELQTKVGRRAPAPMVAVAPVAFGEGKRSAFA